MKDLSVELSEDQIQKKIIKLLKQIPYKGMTLADYAHHSPNGGKKKARSATNFKAMGTKSGYPDLIIDIAKNGYHGLRIELKKEKGGKVSDEQKERLQMLNDEGYRAVVCCGYDEAVKEVGSYMGVNL